VELRKILLDTNAYTKLLVGDDIWIAAHTMETGSTLITFDVHFKKIDGLRIWDNYE
jgi:tRNA(fMet)-specific endonuclease VapC